MISVILLLIAGMAFMLLVDMIKAKPVNDLDSFIWTFVGGIYFMLMLTCLQQGLTI